jgi:nuclear RNA export factor
MDPDEKARLEANPAYQLMKDFLGRRYEPATKLLDLSTIAADQEILQSGMFATEGAQKKFFPALMKVCDSMLETQEAKDAAIESVTLAGNNLPNTHVVYTLVHTFRNIKNLDLSNNAFTIQSLQPWKGRFRNLEHLIVDPMETPGWEEELISWFPKLKILNGKQVRPDDSSNNTSINISTPVPASTPIPSGTPTPTPTPGMMDAEQQRKEEMVLYVQQQTNLKRYFAVQCLEAAGWNIEQAGVLFQQSQPTLPADAYN